METKNKERNLKDRLIIEFKGLVLMIIGVFISFWGLIWLDYFGIFAVLFGGFFIYGGEVLMNNTKYETIQCKCGKEIHTTNDLMIIFCPNCKEKIKLIREENDKNK